MAVGAKKVNFNTQINSYDYTLNNKESAYTSLKRFVDVFLSLFGIIVSAPIILIFGILIKIESPGPVFYKQERVGLNGKCFNIIKLRSMQNNAEKNGPQWAQKNDCRVTKVGAFIRKTRIDELPQFVNVLMGHMSIIGPRPERLVFTTQFEQEYPGFVNRLKVKPGLTGWAQVNGGYDISPKEKLEYDLEYIENMNLKMDLNIVLRTVKVIITGDGAR